MGSVALSTIGIIFAIILIIILAFKGVHVTLLGPVAALIIALTGAMSFNDFLSNYASGYGSMVAGTLMLYSSTMVFCVLMMQAGYLHSIAYFIADHIGAKHTALVCMIACTIFTIGGLSASGYLVMYSIGLILCSKANYNRSFLAAAVMCPSWTFAGTMPLAANTPNGILQPALGTGSAAGLIPGLISAAVMFVIDAVILERLQHRGGEFDSWDQIKLDEDMKDHLPPAWKAFLPIILVFVLYNVAKLGIVPAVFIACVWVTVLEFPKLGKGEFYKRWQQGFIDAMGPVAGVAAMSGIGTVLTMTPAWNKLLSFVTTATLNPYILIFIFVIAVGACLGSGSAAVRTALTGLQPLTDMFLEQGATLGNIHRLIAISAHSTSALPCSGGIVAAFGLFHSNTKESYAPVGITCVLVPLVVCAFVTIPLMMAGL